jgi:hypothetical protein
MMIDENQSPFNWYTGTYIVGFTLVDVDQQHDLHDQYDGWEVSVMVKADSCKQAFDRIAEIAERDTRGYIGELDGISVDWQFKGIIELDPVYTNVDQNTDVIYIEHNHTRIKDQEFLVCNQNDFK